MGTTGSETSRHKEVHWIAVSLAALGCAAFSAALWFYAAGWHAASSADWVAVCSTAMWHAASSAATCIFGCTVGSETSRLKEVHWIAVLLAAL